MNTSMDMNGSPCFECNLYVANKFRQFQNGDYKYQFCLSCNPENKYFVQNPMKLDQCNPSDNMCFDIRYGSSGCLPGQTQRILTYDIQGNLVIR